MDRARWSIGAAGLVASLVGGVACRAALTTVLDLPPPRPAEPAPARPAAPPVAAVGIGPVAPPIDTTRPEIERLPAESVVARLPRDRAGNLDWAAAARHGIIKPRDVLPGRTAPAPGFQFNFDFTYKGPDTLFDASFPHSTHTEWVACQQCHPRIFPYRNTPVTMADVLQGKFCGQCHGKVAFPPATACERCHTRFTSLPPNRAKPELIGNVQLARVADDSGNARGIDAGALPRATFPHWTHRLRFRCKVCHMEIFEPKAGANQVTMRKIGNGEACGRCHNGTIAFAPSVSNCPLCHVASAAPSGS